MTFQRCFIFMNLFKNIVLYSTCVFSSLSFANPGTVITPIGLIPYSLTSIEANETCDNPISENAILVADQKGGGRIAAYSLSVSTQSAEALPWSMNHSDFDSISEVKVSNNGTKILVSYRDGAAIIDICSKTVDVKVNLIGKNPHSIELLPNGSFVTASTTGRDITHWSADGVEITLRLGGINAHAIVFDGNSTLWITGGNKLYKVPYENSRFTWQSAETYSYPINMGWGHDLMIQPGGNTLMLTGDYKIYNFDVTDEVFTLLSGWNQKEVKSISLGLSGLLITRPKGKAEDQDEGLAEAWQTRSVELLEYTIDPQGNYTFKQDIYRFELGDVAIYKARFHSPVNNFGKNGWAGFGEISMLQQRECVEGKGFEIQFGKHHLNPGYCSNKRTVDIACNVAGYKIMVKTALIAAANGKMIDAWLAGCDSEGHGLVKSLTIKP